MNDGCDDLRLAELLCARLCHDLAGPVGAAAAGAELAEESGADAETLALVATSAAGASARLKLFRAAFGPATRPQPAAAVRELIASYLATVVSAASPGVVLEWTGGAADLDADRARMVLNLALVARDSLPRGGTVKVDLGPGGKMLVSAEGRPAELTEDARAVLVDGLAAEGPRGAQALLASRLAGRLGGALVVSGEPGRLTLAVG